MNIPTLLIPLMIGLAFPLSGAGAEREAVIENLRHANPVVRREAAEALSERFDKRALEPLLATLHDPDAEVRRKVATALGAYSGPEVVAALIEALKDPDASVQWAIAESLGRIGEPGLAALMDTTSQGVAAQRWGAARALGKIPGPTSLQPLLQALADDEESAVRREAAEALAGRKDTRVVEALALALVDRDPAVQWQAAHSLAKLRDARAIVPLITAMQDSEPGLRETVSEALVELGPEAIAPLIAALRDEDAGIQAGALAALTRMGSTAVTPLLAELAIAPPEQRENLFETLSMLTADRRQSIRNALTSPDPALRAGAALALGQLKGADAVRSLHPLLNDGDAQVRDAAAEALQTLAADISPEKP